MIGSKFDKLTVISIDKKYCYCVCDCGKDVKITKHCINYVGQHSCKDCRVYIRIPQPKIGDKFGKYTIFADSVREKIGKKGDTATYVYIRCECGFECKKLLNDLRKSPNPKCFNCAKEIVKQNKLPPEWSIWRDKWSSQISFSEYLEIINLRPKTHNYL